MPIKQKLKKALNAIDDAERPLKRARQSAEDDSDIRRALREIEGCRKLYKESYSRN